MGNEERTVCVSAEAAEAFHQGLSHEAYALLGAHRCGECVVFRVFLPATLFLNVYKIQNLAEIEFGYIAYALLVTLALFLIALPVSYLVTDKRERQGPFVQVSFRSNYALVGLPLAGSLFGAEGMMVATLLSAAAIPLFNVLAVISLSVFRGGEQKPSVKKILLGIAKNPLIISIATGLVFLGIRAIFEAQEITFRLTDISPVYTVLEYLSDLSTPLALLVLGAQFEFSAVRALRREIVTGVLCRLVIVPFLALGIAYLMRCFTGAHFAAYVALFASPVAVSSVPMTQELGGDSELAGQLVVFTTLVSALTIFFFSFALKALGVFA